MTLEEMAGGVPPGCAAGISPFATSADLSLYWVFDNSGTHQSFFMKVGIILRRSDCAIFVPHTEFAVLSDVLAGIVRRGKLS